MLQHDDWHSFWERAKKLETQIPVRKREAFARLKASYPSIKQQNFGMLALAGRNGRLTDEVAAAVAQSEEVINEMIAEARFCRQESERLLEKQRTEETRPLLDPSKDPIPPGPYSKLRECKMYPLRRSCNYGENESVRWERCEYMKYDQRKSISDHKRWMCTSPK